VAEAPPQVEVVRGDDPANVVDRSDSPPMVVPLVNLNWVDSKVVGISSNLKIEAFVSKFLDKCPILKVGGNSNFVFFFAEIMAQESPAGVNVLDAYRKRAAKRKGRRSIDALPTTKGSDARGDKGSAGSSHMSKKRARDGGNITTTTCSPGSLPTPPPGRDTVEVDSPSPRYVEQAALPIKANHIMEVSMSPLTLLEGDLHFRRRVRVALPEDTWEVIRGVPSSELLRGGLEMLCHSVVLIQLGIQERERHAEEISRLDHQVAERTDQL